jgi:hypothetical protein
MESPLTLSQFIAAFTKAVEHFGDEYIKAHGEPVNGHFLLRSLVRWIAATIASAPPAERDEMLEEALSQIKHEVSEAMQMKRKMN